MQKALSRAWWMSMVLGGLAGALSATPVVAQSTVDTRCYVFFPDFDGITRSALGFGLLSGEDCALNCFAERQIIVNGEVVSTFEDRREAPVDDCDTADILRFDPSFVRGGPASSELRSALEDLEQEAVNGVVGLHDLPATDISRTTHVYEYGRGALRSLLAARIFEIAGKPANERTGDEQRIADRYADEIKRMRVAAVEFAISEYEAWEDDPCGYTAPEGFSYTPQPGFCSPTGGLINLFDVPAPPSKDDLLAYGAVAVRGEILDTEGAFATAEAARFTQFLTGLAVVSGGTLVLAGVLSATVVAALASANIFYIVFPYATYAVVGFGVSAAAVGVILFAVFVGVLQGFFVFTEAAIPADLQAALAQAQTTPVLSELVQTDEGKQELFDVFMLSTLPDYPGDGSDLPTADRDFVVWPDGTNSESTVERLQFVGWDGAPWETKLARGWLMPRKIPDPDPTPDNFNKLSLFIEYMGCDGQEWSAARVGNRFLLLKNGEDPSTAAIRDEFCYQGAWGGGNWRVRILSDTTPPEITKQVSGTEGNNGWYTSNVGVDWSVVDDDSGVLWTSGCGDRNLTADGSYPLTCSAESEGGRSVDSITVKVDKSPPSISGSIAGLNAAGWSNSTAEASFTCADSASGIASCTAPQVYSSETSGVLAIGGAADRAGNINSATAGWVRIDKTPPNVSGSATPAANAAGWNNTDVEVTFDCTDSLSGIDFCTEPEVLTSDVSGRIVIGSGSDRAGNLGSDAVGPINIDKTPPSVLVTTPHPRTPTFLLNEVVMADWSASDERSGLASAIGTVASGEALDTSTVGLHVFEVTATDFAGNETTRQREYEVIDNVAAFDFTVETVTLSTWRDSPRDNGFVTLRGRLVDPNPDGTFIDRLLEGGFAVQVRDADGSFDVTVELPDCEQRGARGALCRARVPRPVVISIVPEDRRAENPASFELRVIARKLPDSETGPVIPGTNPIEGPVEVTLRRGTAATSTELTDCTPRGYGTLICDGAR